MSLLSVLFIIFMYILTGAPLLILLYIVFQRINDRDVAKERKQALFVIIATFLMFPHPIALMDGTTHIFVANLSSMLLSLLSFSWEYYAPWTMKYTASALLATGCITWLVSLKIFNEKHGGYNLDD